MFREGIIFYVKLIHFYNLFILYYFIFNIYKLFIRNFFFNFTYKNLKFIFFNLNKNEIRY